MTNTTCCRATKIDSIQRGMERLLRRANAGSPPDRIDLHVGSRPLDLQTASDLQPGRDTLWIEVSEGGRLTATVDVGTHWTAVRHGGLTPTITAGDQLVFMGHHAGQRIHFWVEDGRFHGDRGWPVMSAAQAAEASAAFSAALATLIAAEAQ